MPASTDWNGVVLQANRFPSPNKNSRRPTTQTPTHIVIHVTGTDSLTSVKKTFLADKSVSAHYLVTKDGEVLQFVPDAFRAVRAA